MRAKNKIKRMILALERMEIDERLIERMSKDPYLTKGFSEALSGLRLIRCRLAVKEGRL